MAGAAGSGGCSRSAARLVGGLVTLGAPTIPLRATPGVIAGLVRAQDVLLASPIAGHLALRRRMYVDLALRRRSRLRRHLPAAPAGATGSTCAPPPACAPRCSRTVPGWPRTCARSPRAYAASGCRPRCEALQGEHDRVVPARLVGGGDSVAEDLRAEIVPGAGHLLPEEAPELVARRAGKFFAERG